METVRTTESYLLYYLKQPFSIHRVCVCVYEEDTEGILVRLTFKFNCLKSRTKFVCLDWSLFCKVEILFLKKFSISIDGSFKFLDFSLEEDLLDFTWTMFPIYFFLVLGDWVFSRIN